MTLSEQETTAFVRELMTAFAERTGLSGGRKPTRYLWTDAFAVCNFLGLASRTGDGSYRKLALGLVNQVHVVLGRHREDDPRTGWISGLDREGGELHPTKGGLRIGKKLNERAPDEPMDEHLEWERDGQYFHYLTKWMHALGCAARVSGEPLYLRWAAELADTAYDRFTYVPPSGGRPRMYWKMSIDLSRPLVSDMGQHDPLDGLIAFAEIRAAADDLGQGLPVDLVGKAEDLRAMCEGERLATADPLGIGGLLTAAHSLAQLTDSGVEGYGNLLETLLDQAVPGLEHQLAKGNVLSLPRDHRLAFRELGLTIGLRAAKHIQDILTQSPAAFEPASALRTRLDRLMSHAHLIETIEGFWLDPDNRKGAAWRGHEDINSVMLATSLAPEGFLGL